MINYWNRLVTGNENKYALRLLNVMKRDMTTRGLNFKWLAKIEKTLKENGFAFVYNQNYSDNMTTQLLYISLKDQALQKIRSAMSNSTKGRSYQFLKDEWEQENYISSLDYQQTVSLCRFRTSNFKFPIETGRYQNISIEYRKCPFCMHSPGDEFHYLFECHEFSAMREKNLEAKYYQRPSMHKMKQLLNSKNQIELGKLCSFITLLMKKVV